MPEQGGPAQTGPAQIRAQARPDLCWQAAGNGSPVTLAHCGPAEGQQWALTSNGVLMNGDGYCLQAGSPGAGLLVGFDGQCDGGPGQRWAYHGTGGQFAGDGGTCAVLGGSLAPGATVTSGTCAGGTAWTFGAVVAPAHRVSPRPRATPGRAVVHPATVPPAAAAAARPDTTVWSGLPLAALLAGLLLVTGVTLVLFGRRSRRAARPRPVPPPAPDRRLGDSGPYVVDVTNEVARRQPAQGVADTRPKIGRAHV